MKKIISIALFFLSILTCAQTSDFSIANYNNFLNAHKNMSSQSLLSLYDAGKFRDKIQQFPSTVKYLDSVTQAFKLTDYEKSLLTNNGFIVTERISTSDIIPLFQKVYNADLPVFISTDAILKAFHESYDKILKGVEISFLIPKLETMLTSMQSNFSYLDTKYSSDTSLTKMLHDVDLYLSVAHKLLNTNAQPFYLNNTVELNSLLSDINGLTIVDEPLFSTTPRKVDYSQFQPRGHYTDSQYPQLASYFKTMMWLGRIEIYLTKPAEADLIPTDQDIQRQITDSFLISELMNNSGSKTLYDQFEKVISSFVGDQDNVTLDQLNSVFTSAAIQSVNDLKSSYNIKRFQDTLSTKPFAGQKILSQLLMGNPYDVNKIVPATSFLLFGQRFVVDSYITGNVVYDKVAGRMLPSTLDILFSLGNNAAAQLLKSELDTYNYSANLAALRYLIDSYNSDFWDKSVYNLWLNSIRSLNPPADRSTLPQFMQTGSWWQEKINTQLASWTELRHDNILYSKQSYTAMVLCSYPYGYVEPIPAFYSTLKEMANQTINKFSNLPIDLTSQKSFLNGFALTMDTLQTIATKELNNISLNGMESNFIRSILYTVTANDGCSGSVKAISGWYANRLIYNYPPPGSIDPVDNVVADYHTSPTDADGNIVGWVKHAGTGPVNLCVVVANLPGVGDVAFAGPVSSYYEYTTTNFVRLTDDDWRDTYLSKSLRPDFVNSYLADNSGNSKGTGSMLITSVGNNNSQTALPKDYELQIQNYPNPFNPTTTIVFSIPQSLAYQKVELKIFNITGEQIASLLSKELQSGNYLVKWNGKDQLNQNVSSGIYFYQLKVGTHFKAGKMNLIK
jgi:hypothetical protein